MTLIAKNDPILDPFVIHREAILEHFIPSKYEDQDPSFDSF